MTVAQLHVLRMPYFHGLTGQRGANGFCLGARDAYDADAGRAESGGERGDGVGIRPHRLYALFRWSGMVSVTAVFTGHPPLLRQAKNAVGNPIQHQS